MASPTSEPFRLRRVILLVGQWCAVISLFVVPINKPATNVALVLAVLASLLGSDLRQRWLQAWRSPIARGVLLWWCVVLASVLHAWLAAGRIPPTGTAFWAFLYPMVFASLLQTRQWRERALGAFVMAMLLVLLLSYGMYLGVVPQREIALGSPDMRNTVFKEYTQQGLATLILGCIAVARSFASEARRRRIFFAAIALLAFANVTMVIESRTTYIVLVPLMLYWGYRLLHLSSLKLRHWAMIGVATLVVGVAVWEVSPIHDRLLVAIPAEVAQYEHSGEPTSAGIRLELWQHTLSIIRTAPWFGHGYGQWLPLYRQTIQHLPDAAAFMEGHPHQEMLLIASEEGLVGLAIYLLLLGALLRYIIRLDRPGRDIYVCIFLTYLTAGLGNCLWADFSHRHLFILLLACIPPLSHRPTKSAMPIPPATTA